MIFGVKNTELQSEDVFKEISKLIFEMKVINRKYVPKWSLNYIPPKELRLLCYEYRND